MTEPTPQPTELQLEGAAKMLAALGVPEPYSIEELHKMFHVYWENRLGHDAKSVQEAIAIGLSEQGKQSQINLQKCANSILEARQRND